MKRRAGQFILFSRHTQISAPKETYSYSRLSLNYVYESDSNLIWHHAYFRLTAFAPYYDATCKYQNRTALYVIWLPSDERVVDIDLCIIIYTVCQLASTRQTAEGKGGDTEKLGI
jgi:hypothetical protein